MKDKILPESLLDDNHIQPFLLESSNYRGRVARMGYVLDDILSAHNYPKPVAHMVGETAMLALLLSSMLKYEGIFTLQAQGDGPVSMIVADVTSDGKLRACGTYHAERLEKSRKQIDAIKSVESSANHLAQYLGKGYIAFTVDQAESGGERYQGIVELRGASLVDCVQHYFNQSEQIGTGIKMAIGQRNGAWRGSGIMLQKMPEEDTVRFQSNQVNLDEDDWRRAMVFLQSCTDDELLDPDIGTQDILARLFLEEGVRIFPPKGILKECRCSDEKVFGVLRMLDSEDRAFMIKEDRISMVCEFCSKEYSYDARAMEKKIAEYSES